MRIALADAFIVVVFFVAAFLGIDFFVGGLVAWDEEVAEMEASFRESLVDLTELTTSFVRLTAAGFGLPTGGLTDTDVISISTLGL